MTGILLLIIIVIIALGSSSLLGRNPQRSGSGGQAGSKPWGPALLSRIVFLIAAVMIGAIVFRVIPPVVLVRIAIYVLIFLGPVYLINRVIPRNTSRSYYQEQPRAKPRRRIKTQTPYEILGIEPTASKEDIASAYRSMAKKYHPDTVANMAPEFRELAEQRMKAINAAYDQLNGNSRR
ncbi:MAG TPA: J domain-containing protein [Anaerolineae bacterium]